MGRRGRWGTTVAALALTGAVLTGCGDDADDGAAPGTGGDGEAAAGAGEWCDAFVAVGQGLEQLPWDDPDALATAVEEDLEPLLEVVESDAPAELAGGAAVLVEGVRHVTATFDFDRFSEPDFAEAQQAVFTRLGPTCDLPTVEVTATDFAFEGLPESVPAGLTVLLMHNRSEAGELHELGIARVAGGIDLDAEGIFALPGDEPFDALEPVGGTSAPAGMAGGATVDLEPGRYVLFCMIPVGSVDGEMGDGPPHAMAGMVADLTVT